MCHLRCERHCWKWFRIVHSTAERSVNLFKISRLLWFDIDPLDLITSSNLHIPCSVLWRFIRCLDTDVSQSHVKQFDISPECIPPGNVWSTLILPFHHNKQPCWFGHVHCMENSSRVKQSLNQHHWVLVWHWFFKNWVLIGNLWSFISSPHSFEFIFCYLHTKLLFCIHMQQFWYIK